MSQAKLRSAKFSINELIKQDHSHSFASQADMRHMLFRCIKDLHHLGFKVGHINGLKAKHIYALVDYWKAEGKNTGTIKNYMSKLRHVARLLNNQHLIKPNNDAYKIEKRSYAPTTNKAIHFIDLAKCTDSYIRLSLEGQALFGLRREESMKFTLSEAYYGDFLYIKPSWTKGGVGRTIKITNNEQRQWLNKVGQLVHAGKSLIPKERSYKQHLHRYQVQAKTMGLSRLHGLRHAYAQKRYRELAQKLDPKKQGWPCPLEGGKKRDTLSPKEKAIDRAVRKIISQELGHARINITKIYCA